MARHPDDGLVPMSEERTDLEKELRPVGGCPWCGGLILGVARFESRTDIAQVGWNGTTATKIPTGQENEVEYICDSGCCVTVVSPVPANARPVPRDEKVLTERVVGPEPGSLGDVFEREEDPEPVDRDQLERTREELEKL